MAEDKLILRKTFKAGIFHSIDTGTLVNEKTFTSQALMNNDLLDVTIELDFSEPKPLPIEQQILKIYNDAADYIKGFHIGNYNDEYSDWD